MPEKKEGAEQKCGKCGTPLTCNSKTYAAYQDKPERTVLQWQNDDGTAHYTTRDGKSYTCKIPADNTTTTQESKIETTNASVLPNEIFNKIDDIHSMITDIHKYMKERIGPNN